MGWLDKAKDWARGAYGKAKSTVEKIGSMFDKGKEMYKQGKEAVVNLPVVGNLAAEQIGKLEQKAASKIQERTGYTPQQLESMGQNARREIANLPNF